MERIFESQGDRNSAWRAIRLTRSTLPGGMAESRRGLYSSALEQAEQQFRAAASVGPESRPLNLFYGLSQAGRAVAAAHTPAGVGMSPEVAGHGLKIPGLSSLRGADDIFDLRVVREGGRDTSFGRLAWVLESDDLGGAGVSLGAVWMMLLEVALDFPIEGHHQTQFVHRSGDAMGMAIPEDDDGAAALRSAYPQLAAAVVTDGILGYSGESREAGIPIRRLELSGSSGVFSNYRGAPALMPAWEGSAGILDPLLAWWVMLYTLSMLARYKPVEWTRAIDIDRSPRAVWLEQLLAKALDAVPHQVEIALAGRARAKW